MYFRSNKQVRKEEVFMSGHSKFANIKHKKEKNDAAKGKIFTIIGREIAVAVKDGGPDPANNFKLAQVIAKAKASNMPNDTIERGIKKASVTHLQRDTEASVHRDAFPICSMKRDRSLSQKKTVRWMRMI